MGRRVIIVIVIVLALAALATAIGFGAHHAGYHNGIADRGQVTVTPNGGYGYPGYGHGFGFFPGFFFSPLVLLLLVFALVFWWRPFRGRACGHGGPRTWAHGGPRQTFEEWHREAHGETAPPAAQQPPQSGQGQQPESPPAGDEPAQ